MFQSAFHVIFGHLNDVHNYDYCETTSCSELMVIKCHGVGLMID